jgi:hypothetical protein
MSLFPETTNGQYRGSPIAPIGLGLVATLTIIPGCIHYFLPDGGAGVIAHIDLSVHRAEIVGVFAWMGATQIPWGVAQLVVAVRYRSLIALFLALDLLMYALSALAGWVTRAPPTGHHPPEHYGVLAGLVVISGLLALAMRPARRGLPQ